MIRARYIPGQGFEVEGTDQKLGEQLGCPALLSYADARAVSPLFEAELYSVLVSAQAEPWAWKEN